MRKAIYGVVFLVMFLLLNLSYSQAGSNVKTGAMAKVDTGLANLSTEYKDYRTKAITEGVTEPFTSTNTLLHIKDDRVVIDAVTSGNMEALKADLKVLGSSKNFNLWQYAVVPFTSKRC